MMESNIDKQGQPEDCIDDTDLEEVGDKDKQSLQDDIDGVHHKIDDEESAGDKDADILMHKIQEVINH